MIPRVLETALKKAVKRYPVVALLGPRQSGKTTLARHAFPRLPYVSLEDPDTQAFAVDDPRGFLGRFSGGAILDEVQRAPALFSFIQTRVDERDWKGRFILTGSQHFGLMERITQSLAGRASIQTLLPLSLEELRLAGRTPSVLNELLFTGGYPRIYDKRIPPMDWLGNYVRTYLDRDVRLLKNVGDLLTFHQFLRMTAHRCGQLVNLSSLASDCGITHNTAKAWLSVLEASFIVFLVSPHHRNFDKRVKKSPKLYFYDTGLLCSLVGVERAGDLAAHSMRGAVFESFVLSEMIKRRWNEGLPANLFFWQDKLGREVDCIIERGETLTPIEIKAGQTIGGDYFNNLLYWSRLAGARRKGSYLVYAGDENQKRRGAVVVGWRSLEELPK